jgi:hypothetical protein
VTMLSHTFHRRVLWALEGLLFAHLLCRNRTPCRPPSRHSAALQQLPAPWDSCSFVTSLVAAALELLEVGARDDWCRTGVYVARAPPAAGPSPVERLLQQLHSKAFLDALPLEGAVAVVNLLNWSV